MLSLSNTEDDIRIKVIKEQRKSTLKTIKTLISEIDGMILEIGSRLTQPSLNDSEFTVTNPNPGVNVVANIRRMGGKRSRRYNKKSKKTMRRRRGRTYRRK